MSVALIFFLIYIERNESSGIHGDRGGGGAANRLGLNKFSRQ